MERGETTGTYGKPAEHWQMFRDAIRRRGGDQEHQLGPTGAGFGRIDRTECAQAAHMLYKNIASRNQKRSTALVTNVDFDKWGEIWSMALWRWPSSTDWSRERSSSRAKARLIAPPGQERRKPHLREELSVSQFLSLPEARA